MRVIKYRVNGEVRTRRLCRRNLTTQQFLENRHPLRREARDHFHSISGSRVSPATEDILTLELWDGHCLMFRVGFNKETGHDE